MLETGFLSAHGSFPGMDQKHSLQTLQLQSLTSAGEEGKYKGPGEGQETMPWAISTFQWWPHRKAPEPISHLVGFLGPVLLPPLSFSPLQISSLGSSPNNAWFSGIPSALHSLLDIEGKFRSDCYLQRDL